MAPILSPPADARPGTDATETPGDVAGAFERRLLALGRPARILLAEDSSTNQFVTARLLNGFDLQIDVVGDGLEALHAASGFRYDAICMDMHMPEMDGLAATRAIRALGSGLVTIPIIALTANASPEDVAACFNAGMTGFVAKPLSKATLLAALLTALDSRDADGAIQGVDLAAAVAGRDRPLDHDGFEQLKQAIGIGGVTELITVFEAETRARLTVVAEPGLERAKLILEMHGLKGAAAAACAEALSRLAASLEMRMRHDDTMTGTDLINLTEAFEAWRVAVDTSWPTDSMAA